MWEDTVVVLTTDHGHLLGEHGYWAKNYMMDYEELAHIPLIVCRPGEASRGRAVTALTATIDLMPTFMELHGATVPEHVHGRSLGAAMDGAQEHHDAVLFGYFGKDINMVTEGYSYCRQPVPDSTVHHHTAMPCAFAGFLDRGTLASAETGTFLEHTHGIPHFRMGRKSKQHADAPDHHLVFDLTKDPKQQHAIRDPQLDARLATKMRQMLTSVDAPPCQFTRMDLE